MFRKKSNIILKSKEEVELLRQASLIVSGALTEVAKMLKPGVTGLQIDKRAEEFIRDNNAIPGFLGYGGFPGTLCISPNEQVVHGIPKDVAFEDGDIVSVDCGSVFKGYYGDSAYSFALGNVSEECEKLLKVTRESLYKGIEQARHGQRIGDIGFAVQQHAEAHGFSVIRELVGHGIGKNLHESPEVPNFGKRGRGPKIEIGLVIAIEPMVNAGRKDIVQSRDGWSIMTKDKRMSAHYEHSIAVLEEGPSQLSSHDEVDDAVRNNDNLTFIS